MWQAMSRASILGNVRAGVTKPATNLRPTSTLLSVFAVLSPLYLVTNSAPVAATTPDESGRSFTALLDIFAVLLPRSLRRLGIHGVNLDDAIQEVIVEVWQGRHELPTDTENARREVFRVALRVAERLRWHAEQEKERSINIDDVHLPDPQNIEAWIDARMLVFEALHNLDDSTRTLIISREIDGNTYAEIGATMGEKEDTIRKRVAIATEKFTREINRLLGNRKKQNHSSGAFMALGLEFDPFDRAVFRAILDAEAQWTQPPESGVRPVSTSNMAPFSSASMAVLLGALAMLPAETSRPTPLELAKFGDVRLPDIVFELPPNPPGPMTSVATPGTRVVLPRKTPIRPTAPRPTLDQETLTSLRRTGKPGAAGR
jgi:RNA polymerase sigma factor (sigma-70 family)